MDNIDIFYTILHDLQFFSYFFYKQYLLDTDTKKAFDIKENSSQALSSFFKQYPIKDSLMTNTTITYLANNGILIRDMKHQNYYVVLYMNTTLHFIDSNVLSLDIPLLSNQPRLLEDFLYKNTTQPIYIVFFTFYSNLDLSNQETTLHIKKILQDSLENTCCYFQHLQFNCYYLLFKGLEEADVLSRCLTIYRNFIAIKKPYLCPKFLVVEYPPQTSFEDFVTTVKKHFLQLSFEEEIIVLKKAENL